MNNTVTRTQSSGKSTAMPTPIKLQDTCGQCCCCCELPCIKSIWSEYIWMGNLEVYGDMLQECFNIAWPQSADTNYQICEVCITQLRNALQFKRRILHNHITILDAEDIKQEGIKIKDEIDDTNTGIEQVNTETNIFDDNPRADAASHDDDGNSDGNIDPLDDIHQPDTKDEPYLPPDLRLASGTVVHCLIKLDKDAKGKTKRRRCIRCWKTKKRRIGTLFACENCPQQPGLCIECFRAYHRY